jgi:hypothetical protein
MPEARSPACGRQATTKKKMNKQRELIDLYLKGYNSFNMKKMLLPLHSKIVFENYKNGQLGMKLDGIKAFKKQAQKGVQMFSKRRQEILSIEHEEDVATAVINYSATLKIGCGDKKAGDVMNITGKSIFHFQDDRICKIEDHH